MIERIIVLACYEGLFIMVQFVTGPGASITTCTTSSGGGAYYPLPARSTYILGPVVSSVTGSAASSSIPSAVAAPNVVTSTCILSGGSGGLSTEKHGGAYVPPSPTPRSPVEMHMYSDRIGQFLKLK